MILSNGVADGAASVVVGDYVTFGRYEQDDDFGNGAEAIEWQVLAVEDGKALLISRYLLRGDSYNSSYEQVTWEECSLRTWLNGIFLNDAFTQSEQAWIMTSKVTADHNSQYNTDAGRDTQDKVFLLSLSEAYMYFSDSEARRCKPTARAEAQGCLLYTSPSPRD